MKQQWPFWTVGTGGILLLGSSIVYLMNPDWVIYAQIGASLGLVILLGIILIRPGIVRTLLAGRPVKYASNAIVMSLAFIGIVGLINFLVAQNDIELDLTETGRFTLSEQTLQILQNLDKPVQIIGFFYTQDPRLENAKEYLQRYSRHTNQLRYEFHDPNIEPDLARGYQLQDYGLIFASGDNLYEVDTIDEHHLTSGLLRVINEEEKKIYFTTGHGEYSLTDTTPTGYHTVKQGLEQEGYQIETLNLASISGDTMPEDIAVLVIAGAEYPLLDTAKKVVANWLNEGGRVIILVDPQKPVPLADTLQQYGIHVEDNLVLEDVQHSLVVLGPDGLAPQPLAPLMVEYPYHKITESLDGFQSFYPYVRSLTVQPLEEVSKHTTPLLKSSSGSWAETTLNTDDLRATRPKYDPDLDPKGPFHLAVAAADEITEARLVIFGSTHFLTNQNISPQMANLDIFLNAVDWLAEEEDLISIRPKQPTNRRLFMTSMQVSFTVFTALGVMPILILLIGLVVWWRRR